MIVLHRASATGVIIGWILCVCATTSISAQSQASKDSPSLKKPAWLLDASLRIKEGYDDNVYLSGAEQAFLPAPLPVPPPGSVRALNDRPSWVTTISPKIAIDFAPLLADRKALQVLSIAYAPDSAFYHNEPTESYDAHRFDIVLKGKTSAFLLNLDNAFTYVDGSDVGPFYPGALLSAYGIAAPRERREQFQDRGSFAFQYDWKKWFVRPAASLLYYDLKTALTNVAGYMNYSDRYDVNGGGDLGFRITPKLAITVGYRYGHQYQQQFSFSPYSSPSDYHRALLGFEGKPWKWLDVKLQAGPDFRSYPEDTATHITPVDDKHLVTYYGEALLTATLTPSDTLSFKCKQFQWVSSTGKVPYFDSCYDLSYRRKLTDQLTMNLGGKLLSADYNSGNLPACLRYDLQYTISTGLSYSLNTHINVSLNYSLDLGRNAQEDILNPQTREYDRNLISLGALVKF